MATTGAKFPTSGTSVSETPYDDNAWTTPGNIVSDNGSEASVTAATYDDVGAGDYTEVLKATGFDFSVIPDGSVINGVIVKCAGRDVAGDTIPGVVQLLDTSGARVGTSQHDAQSFGATETVLTWGSSTNTWGNSLTAAWVKNSNFGVGISFDAEAANTDVYVDYITIEVYYTAPYSLTVEKADLVLTGKAVTLNSTWSIPVAKGDLAFAGKNFEIATVLGKGDLAFTGKDVTLTYVVPDDYTLPVEKGDLTLTGKAVTTNSTLLVAKGDAAFSGKTSTFDEDILVTYAPIAFSGKNSSFNETLGITPTTAAFSGKDSSFSFTLPVAKGDLAFSGKDLTLVVDISYTLTVEPSTLQFTGRDQAFNSTLGVAKADATLTPQTISFAATFLVEDGTLTFTPQEVSLLAVNSFTLAVDPASIAFSGKDVPHTWTLPVAKGSLAFAGKDFEVAQVFGAGSLAFTGKDITFIYGSSYTLSVDVGSLALTGKVVSFDEDLLVSKGDLLFSPKTVTLIAENRIAVEYAPLTFSGKAVTLLNSGDNYTLAVDPASIAFTGENFEIAVTFGAGDLAFSGKYSDLITPFSTGNLTFIGKDVQGTTSGSNLFYLFVGSAPLTLAGKEVDLIEDVFFTYGTFAFTGKDVGSQRGTAVEKGSLAFVGKDVTLSYTGNYVASVTSTPLTFIGKDVTLNTAGVNVTFPVTGSPLTFIGKDIGLRVSIPVTKADMAFTGTNMFLYHQVVLPVTSGSLSFTGKAISFIESSPIIPVGHTTAYFYGSEVGLTISSPTNEGRIDRGTSLLIDTTNGAVLLYPKDGGYYVIHK